ncbi:TGF beta receptor associated protein 1 [Aspergillus luchuensis]|uniref:TGF beta receptor associated protein 1 n=1 Tax=Aspergillus kawachii TaxID=1069201 RepID=A0A146FS30_ASPKA|nr:TGF beta receptor associated protein 1 [Aspergillus luchuensis]
MAGSLSTIIPQCWILRRPTDSSRPQPVQVPICRDVHFSKRRLSIFRRHKFSNAPVAFHREEFWSGPQSPPPPPSPHRWSGGWKKLKVRTPVQTPSTLFCMKDATERSPATANDVMAVL